VELDAGFQPGRQYGRGRSGGQVRDDKGATGRTRTAAAQAQLGDKRERDIKAEDNNNKNEEEIDDDDGEEHRSKRQRIVKEDDDDKKNW